MKRWQWIAMWVGAAAIGVAQPDPNMHTIKIVLSAEVVVDGPQVCLSLIGELEGPASLTGNAGALTLGTFISKGQVLWIDRNTILSRLAGIGIDASCVELSGADMVKIKRKETVIGSELIAQKAKDYLEQQLVGRKIASLTLLRQPTSIVLDDPNIPAELSCAMSRYQTPGTLKVDVTVSRKGLLYDHSDVIFTIRYKVRQAVALKEIEAGVVITSENVQIQEIQALSPEQKMDAEPYGLMTRRKIIAGAIVRPDWLAPCQSPVTIRRNQHVLVKVDTGGLYLSAPGQAMDDGRVGDIIRIRRGMRPEEVTIYCIVQSDGTVQPQI